MSFLHQLKNQANALQVQRSARDQELDAHLDGETPWPPMKQVHFRVDARRKQWRAGEALLTATWPAPRVTQGVLDELAKRIVGEPSRLV